MSYSDHPHIKCTKAYLFTEGLPDYNEIQNIIEDFSIEIRPFSHPDKVIKETTYFFSVTVLAEDKQIAHLQKIFMMNSYADRVKFISIPANIKPTL